MLNPSVKNSSHVFYYIIKPILQYGGEKWGSFNTQSARFRNTSMDPDEIYYKALCEKLHIKFCRYILRVHKNCANLTVLAKLGILSLDFNIISPMLK